MSLRLNLGDVSCENIRPDKVNLVTLDHPMVVNFRFPDAPVIPQLHPQAFSHKVFFIMSDRRISYNFLAVEESFRGGEEFLLVL